MRRFAILCFAFAIAVPLVPARADDLTGADRFICSAMSVSTCCDDDQCATGTATELGVPQFVEFDLVAKRISTTKASGLNRASTIDTVKRADGRVFAQGTDNGRAFSYVINEKTGHVAAAIAGGECSVMAYGACTPISAAK